MRRQVIRLLRPISSPISPKSLLCLYPAISRAPFASMNRPRNRQPRPPRGGGGNRDSGRGSKRPSGTPQQAAGTVPTSSQVVPGASVFIVLKEDQPTGHETAGVVQDILTNGNHPRGIKVRLRNGQVGRVQRMSAEVEGTTQNAANPPVGSNAGSSTRGGGVVGAGRFTHRYTDVRNDDHFASEPPPRSLADFMPAASEDVAAAEPAALGPTVNCPICEAFEGDEAAVTHHIEQAHLG